MIPSLRSRNAYMVAYDGARVLVVAAGLYCGVKLAWELAHESVPEAFRSLELARASPRELERERSAAWNALEGRPMTEREFVLAKAVQRRQRVEAALGEDRPRDLSEEDARAYYHPARRRVQPLADVWQRVQRP